MVLPAAVTITAWTQSTNADANDSGDMAPAVTSTVVTGYPHSDGITSVIQGVASSDASIDFTAGTLGLPVSLGASVTGFDVQFQAEVNANVDPGAVGSSARAFGQLKFTVEVLDNEADFTFAQTGNDADTRFIVNGEFAGNVGQTIRLGVGSYNVVFSDGAGAFTQNINQTASIQKNAQSYSLKVVEVIPEPGTVLLAGIALFGLLRRRR